MIKIIPDHEGWLTQWDKNRTVLVSGLDLTEYPDAVIQFSSPNDGVDKAYVIKPYVGDDGLVHAKFPNILLTVSGRIDVFVYRDDHTCVRGVFVVAPREKPDDYIYEETEVLKYEDIVERLDELETQKEDKANKVTTVDDNSDDEHYPTAKAVYKAIPKSLKNPYSLTFTGAVTGSYDGSKPMTFNIPVGGSGTDISLGVTGASVGDIIKVKQVDADGKPTEWEAAEMPEKLPNTHTLTFTGAASGSYDGSAPLTVNIPSGEGGGYVDKNLRHIATVAVTSGTTSYSVTADSDGTAFSLMNVYILVSSYFGTAGSYLQVKLNNKELPRAYGERGSQQVIELEKMGDLQKLTVRAKPSYINKYFGDYYNGQNAVNSISFWTVAAETDATIEIYGVDA